MPIKLISTDFDGTIFAEFENPPIPPSLQHLLASLQRRGVVWVINTGRELGSLLETLARADSTAHPDALVLVEREIYLRKESEYLPVAEWNETCTRNHESLFASIAPDLPRLVGRLKDGIAATFYEDAFSPLCVLAEDARGADIIEQELTTFARSIPELSVVRNDVYIRFAHGAFNKGTALAEVARRLEISASEILAAGNHYNDLPMLHPAIARWLVAPANAIPEVQDQVRTGGGFLSNRPNGEGVAQGIEYFLERT